jgi:hypothetical protein
MSRTIIRLALGGTMLLIAAGCAPQPTTESIPADAESLEVAGSDAGNTDAQSQESKERPIVTVSRSPT